MSRKTHIHVPSVEGQLGRPRDISNVENQHYVSPGTRLAAAVRRAWYKLVAVYTDWLA